MAKKRATKKRATRPKKKRARRAPDSKVLISQEKIKEMLTLFIENYDSYENVCSEGQDLLLYLQDKLDEQLTRRYVLRVQIELPIKLEHDPNGVKRIDDFELSGTYQGKPIKINPVQVVGM